MTELRLLQVHLDGMPLDAGHPGEVLRDLGIDYVTYVGHPMFAGVSVGYIRELPRGLELPDYINKWEDPPGDVLEEHRRRLMH